MGSLDVKKIREDMGMSQRQFAHCFQFPLGTLQHWEQRKRSPTGPARVLLTVIARRPELVREALQAR